MPETQDYLNEIRSYKARGFPAYKAHPPGPWRKDMEIHRALREAAGDDYVLMTDPVSEYSLEEAIRVGRDLEKLNYHWFEEPFRDFELHKYAKLSAALDIPIAGTETTRDGSWGVAQAIAFDAVDIVRADVSWKPGVTGTLKIAHLAEAHGMAGTARNGIAEPGLRHFPRSAVVVGAGEIGTVIEAFDRLAQIEAGQECAIA